MTDEQPPTTTVAPGTTPGDRTLNSLKGVVDVDGQDFGWSEWNHPKGSKVRKFDVWRTGTQGSKVRYRPDPSPIEEDEKVYHRDVEQWYAAAARAVAKAYIGNNNEWPELIEHANVKSHNYNMRREEA
ncbi:hypothetical protein ABGB17_02680 [Sphaerisporangium sp. B11E5]|uniref:hypothetical protein n=1 Tax=Sphaerisporangium sp. B11E5 TaxID=3153563 RepID=UPI00325D44DF